MSKGERGSRRSEAWQAAVVLAGTAPAGVHAIKTAETERVDGTCVTIGRRILPGGKVGRRYAAEYRELTGKPAVESLRTTKRSVVQLLMERYQQLISLFKDREYRIAAGFRLGQYRDSGAKTTEAPARECLGLQSLQIEIDDHRRGGDSSRLLSASCAAVCTCVLSRDGEATSRLSLISCSCTVSYPVETRSEGTLKTWDEATLWGIVTPPLQPRPQQASAP